MDPARTLSAQTGAHHRSAPGTGGRGLDRSIDNLAYGQATTHRGTGPCRGSSRHPALAGRVEAPDRSTGTGLDEVTCRVADDGPRTQVEARPGSDAGKTSSSSPPALFSYPSQREPSEHEALPPGTPCRGLHVGDSTPPPRPARPTTSSPASHHLIPPVGAPGPATRSGGRLVPRSSRARGSHGRDRADGSSPTRPPGGRGGRGARRPHVLYAFASASAYGGSAPRREPSAR
ncbi:unnamed protein product [Diplocarpon coronariae]|nr:hypothetical protein JHW43_009610 [Diplocarpon mali]